MSEIHECWNTYWWAIQAYLLSIDEAARRKAKRHVRQCARSVDNATPGARDRKNSVAKKVTSLLEGLDRKNRKVWADFLVSIPNGGKLFVDLKSISPFSNERLLVVKYDGVNVELVGEIRAHIQELCVASQKPPGTYVVAFPKEPIDKAIWVPGTII